MTHSCLLLICLFLISFCSNRKDTQRRDLLEELVYLYFRFISFESMGNGVFESAELKYDEPTLACFYSSMALNRELCGDVQNALAYHEKALKMWE